MAVFCAYWALDLWDWQGAESRLVNGPELRASSISQERGRGTSAWALPELPAPLWTWLSWIPASFSIVHKTLMFYMLFQKIYLFFYIPLCRPSGLAVWIWAEVLWLEFKKGKKKMTAQAVGFLIEACQIPQADAFSSCSSWIRGLLFGFKDKGNTYPIRWGMRLWHTGSFLQ